MTTTKMLQFCAVVCTPTPSGFLFPLVAAAPLEGREGGGGGGGVGGGGGRRE